MSLTGSTTDGCNIVLAGLELQPEDEIVTTSEEHFGLIGPLHTSAARVDRRRAGRRMRSPAAVTRRTKLLALSQVLWTSGRLLPVRELREQTGVPVLVDGAQSVGAIPVAAAGLDFLTVSGQKWLCGPDSTGALVVADPERLRVAHPSYFSQTAHEPSGSFEPAEGAARFDPGWLSSASPLGAARCDLAGAARTGPTSTPPDEAARCRELLAPLVDVVPGGATLVAFRARGSARRSWPGWRRPASSSARSRRPGSSASRAAGGRARTTSQRLRRAAACGEAAL